MIRMANTIFQKIMGSSPRIKVFEYLLEWKSYDLTISDIARGSGISRNKTTEIVNELARQDILKHTRNIGQGQFYILNKENDIVQQLAKLFKTIVKAS